MTKTIKVNIDEFILLQHAIRQAEGVWLNKAVEEANADDWDMSNLSHSIAKQLDSLALKVSECY